jgi:hypothetical protein
MFYCDPCAEHNDWPNMDFLPTSFGKCEMCEDTAVCYDVPSRYLDTHRLTAGQVAQNEEIKAINSIKQTIEKRSND